MSFNPMMSMYNPYYPAAQFFRPHLNPAQQGAHAALKAFNQSNTPTYISSNASLNDTGSSRSDNSSDSPPHSTHHHHLGKFSFLKKWRFLRNPKIFRKMKRANKTHPTVFPDKLPVKSAFICLAVIFPRRGVNSLSRELIVKLRFPKKFGAPHLTTKKRRTRRIRLRFGPVSRIDKSIFRRNFTKKITELFQTSRTSTLEMAKSSVESVATERLAFTTESSAAKDAKASSSARSATAACTAVRGTEYAWCHESSVIVASTADWKDASKLAWTEKRFAKMACQVGGTSPSGRSRWARKKSLQC